MLRPIAKIVSLIAAAVLIVPSVLYLAGKIELENVKSAMLIVTIIWFVTASLWMWNSEGDESGKTSEEVESV